MLIFAHNKAKVPQVKLSGGSFRTKEYTSFLTKISKLNYNVKHILMGMLKAELVSKKQNHDEKIVWELLKSHC